MDKYNTHGGYFAPQGLLKINEGGKHDENPNGGVQIGVDQQGIPNLVEEGEVIFDDFVYSDNIKADGGFLKENNIPAKYEGQLYSDIAGKIADEAEEQIDPITLNGVRAMLGRLANAQEAQKKAEEEKALMEELKNMSPEELAALEQALAQEQEMPEEQIQPEVVPTEIASEQVVPQQPVMAMGGPVNKFEIGGPDKTQRMLDSATRRFMEQGQSGLPISPVTGLPYEQPLVPEYPEMDVALAVAQPGSIVAKAMAPSVYKGIAQGLATGEADALSAFTPGIRATFPRAAGKLHSIGKKAAINAENYAKESATALNETSNNITNLAADKAKAKAARDAAFNRYEQLLDRTLTETDPEKMAALHEEIQSALKEIKEQRGIVGDKRLELIDKKLTKFGNNLKNKLAKLNAKVWGVNTGEAGAAPEATAESAPVTTEPAPAQNVGGAKKRSGWKKAAIGFGVGTGLTGATLGISSALRNHGDSDATKAFDAQADNGDNLLSFDEFMKSFGNSNARGGVINKFEGGTPGETVILEDPLYYPGQTWSYVQRGGTSPYGMSNPLANLLARNPFSYGQDNLRMAYLNLFDPQFRYGSGVLYTGNSNDTIPDETVIPEPEIETEPAASSRKSGKSGKKAAPTAEPAPIERETTLLRPIVTPLSPEWDVNNNPALAEVATPSYLEREAKDRLVNPQLYADMSEKTDGFDPRYLSPLADAAMGLATLATPADRYEYKPIRPYIPTGYLRQQYERYNPIDVNMIYNQMQAQNTANARALLNSGAGPATAALINSADYNGSIELGNALANIWDANNQRRNRVISQNNAADAAVANFDWQTDATRANILNQFAPYNRQNALRISLLNNQAEQDKYNALAGYYNSAKKSLVDTATERMNRNAANTDTSLMGYWVDALRRAHYDPTLRDTLLKTYNGEGE